MVCGGNPCPSGRSGFDLDRRCNRIASAARATSRASPSTRSRAWLQADRGRCSPHPRNRQKTANKTRLKRTPGSLLAKGPMGRKRSYSCTGRPNFRVVARTGPGRRPAGRRAWPRHQSGGRPSPPRLPAHQQHHHRKTRHIGHRHGTSHAAASCRPTWPPGYMLDKARPPTSRTTASNRRSPPRRPETQS